MLKKFALSAALVALSGCASMDRSDAGVQQGMAAFRDAFNKHDSASLAMVYADDARLMPFNVPMLTGRPGIQSFWQARFNQGLSHIEKTPIEVQVLGDTAIEMSRYVVTLGERKIQGKDMLVWRRGTDGKWRIAADIWNNDQPL
ncbi:YybH family protein [Noviherbaspirillum soli]|uniref:YybH family protein n=1 Tax=Noviherbaspirillum soli TaxID=1064518 RepID=UPI00188D4C79|nr:SgcJ/EcaC family oxidoreductase [Noviherbaspirillum soli]